MSCETKLGGIKSMIPLSEFKGVIDNNGIPVVCGDWVKSIQNDNIPCKVEFDEKYKYFYINTYHSTLDLNYCRPFFKCSPCTSSVCCNDYDGVKCTHPELCE